MSLKIALHDKIPFYNTLVLPIHFGQAVKAAIKYRFPARKMTVIAVTGTNGKTSTCFLIWKMLNNAGYKTGVMTTVGWGVEQINQQVEHMTTADSETLNKRMREIAEAGAEFLVLEVTSHAMVQFRTLGVPVEIAVMTNVTHEHLDYHKTFERYRDAKRKLFKKAKFGIVNADDKSGTLFAQDVAESLAYGIKRGKLRARDVKLGVSGVNYNCGGLKIRRSEKAVGATDASEYKISQMNIRTQIPGEFTVYNSLAAVAVGLRLGLSETEITEGIYALESVEGRMNRLALGQDYGVIVDYAHTPDAFIKVYESVVPEMQKTGGRIIALFGGAGRRDESTRAERGEIGGKYSDIVIITEDDSRDEDPKEIAQMFVEGAEKAGKIRNKDLFIELDRAKAIQKACEMAQAGDLVLVLGKGHEKTILRADGAHPFEDLKATERIIKKLMGGK